MLTRFQLNKYSRRWAPQKTVPMLIKKTTGFSPSQLAETVEDAVRREGYDDIGPLFVRLWGRHNDQIAECVSEEAVRRIHQAAYQRVPFTFFSGPEALTVMGCVRILGELHPVWNPVPPLNEDGQPDEIRLTLETCLADMVEELTGHPPTMVKVLGSTKTSRSFVAVVTLGQLQQVANLMAYSPVPPNNLCTSMYFTYDAAKDHGYAMSANALKLAPPLPPKPTCTATQEFRNENLARLSEEKEKKYGKNWAHRGNLTLLNGQLIVQHRQQQGPPTHDNTTTIPELESPQPEPESPITTTGTDMSPEGILDMVVRLVSSGIAAQGALSKLGVVVGNVETPNRANQVQQVGQQDARQKMGARGQQQLNKPPLTTLTQSFSDQRQNQGPPQIPPRHQNNPSPSFADMARMGCVLDTGADGPTPRSIQYKTGGRGQSVQRARGEGRGPHMLSRNPGQRMNSQAPRQSRPQSRVNRPPNPQRIATDNRAQHAKVRQSRARQVQTRQQGLVEIGRQPANQSLPPRPSSVQPPQSTSMANQVSNSGRQMEQSAPVPPSAVQPSSQMDITMTAIPPLGVTISANYSHQVIFVGDSIARNMMNDGPDALEFLNRTTNSELVPMTIPGATLGHLTRHVREEEISVEITNLSTTVVIVAGGNSLYNCHGDELLTVHDCISDPEEGLQALMVELGKQLRIMPNATIVVVEVPPRTYANRQERPNIATFNERAHTFLKNIQSTHNTRHVFLPLNLNHEDLAHDGVHLSTRASTAAMQTILHLVLELQTDAERVAQELPDSVGEEKTNNR